MANIQRTVLSNNKVIGLESDITSNVNGEKSHAVSGRGVQGALARREFPQAFVARFHTKYQKAVGCWLWQASLYHNGYGQVCIGRNLDGTQHNAQAHRVAYVLAHGDIPAGKVVMHSCDTPACVNPAHLSLGTQRDNLRDAVTRGHVKTGLTVGSVRWRAEQLRLGLRPDGRKTRKKAA